MKKRVTSLYKFIVGGVSIVFIVASFVSANLALQRGYVANSLQQYTEVAIVALLFCVVWYLLTDAYVRTRAYAKQLADSAGEAAAFGSLALAWLFLLCNIAVIGWFGMIRLASSNLAYELTTLMLFYGSGVFSLLYMVFIGRTGYLLAKLVGKVQHLTTAGVVIAIAVSIASAYVWNTLIDTPARISNPDQLLAFVSPTAELVSLYIPVTISWIFGLLGAYGIVLYQLSTKGFIYKRLFMCLAFGSVLLVVLSVGRHIGDFIVGSPTQKNVLIEFPRIVVLFIILIIALQAVLFGVRLLNKIEVVR